MNQRLKPYKACPLLLLCVLAGCRHQAPPPPPVAASAPPLTPSSITVITPLPSVPPEAKANVQPAPPELPAPAPVVTPAKRTRRMRRKRATTVITANGKQAPIPPGSGAPSATTPGTAGSLASAAATPEASAAAEAAPALGELSAGTALSSTERTRMLGAIQLQETRLTKIKEAATNEVRAMEIQVKTFLDKARQAVAENDLDGAQTLSTKARVLLDELQSE